MLVMQLCVMCFHRRAKESVLFYTRYRLEKMFRKVYFKARCLPNALYRGTIQCNREACKKNIIKGLRRRSFILIRGGDLMQSGLR